MGKTVAIVGNGFVGRAMHKLFPDAYIFDEPLRIGRREEVNRRDVAFIAVPTNGLPDGTLDMSIVEDVVSWCECPLLVVRSTVNPGTCDRLAYTWTHKDYPLVPKAICYQPEYLGETPSHPFLDMRTRPFLVIGGHPNNRRKLIELYQTVYNANIDIRELSNLEAEVAKLSENRAIAAKVIAVHELYEACQRAGVNFYAIRDTVYGLDPRFNLWFTFADPDNLGFDSSKCLVKDVPAWVAWAEGVGADASLTRQLVEKSKEYAAKRGRPSE